MIENNKLIAEFMGLKVISKDEYLKHPQHETLNVNEYSIIEYQRYHKSWDWLMPVVEKIESLNLGDNTLKTIFSEEDVYLNSSVSFSIMYKECYINFFGEMKVYENWISVTECDSKIKAAYTAVVEFIKWYNENK